MDKPVMTQILVDLGDFTLNRLIPLILIIAIPIVVYRFWRKKA